MIRLTDAKQLIARGLCHPSIGRVISAVCRGKIPSRGFLFDVDNPDVSLDNVARLYWGLYEGNEIRHLRKFLRSDLDVIEFGGGIGAVSMHIIKIQNRAQRLIVVEPNPYLIDTLKKNIVLNAPWKKVEVLNRALDYSGQEEVGLDISSNNLGSKVMNSQDNQRTSVKTTSLKKLLQGYGIGEFALVADAEGAEAGMIIEDTESLMRCHQMIIELHPVVYEGQQYSVDTLCQKLVSIHGFTLIANRHNVYVFDKR
jgi:FkbM family methyltransferase